MTDTRREEIRDHLDLSKNHEAGLIPMATQILLEKIADSLTPAPLDSAPKDDLSCRDIEEITGVSKATASRFLNSGHDIQLSTARKLLPVLGACPCCNDTPAPEAGWRDMDDPELERITAERKLVDIWVPSLGRIPDVLHPSAYVGPTHWRLPPPAPGEPATEQMSVQEAARVLIAEREDHGEGLEGELAPYSLDDEGMVPDLDGDWVKLEAVTAALRSLAQGTTP